MKILAVDDDPIILELLTQFVDAFGGHELTTASSGSEALELLRANQKSNFECFLLDIQMPGMDGIELTQQIRTSVRYVDTPILMLTAMSDKRYVDAAFSAGATDYVTKPFEVAELKARLGLVEGLVQARQSHTSKIFAAKKLGVRDLPDLSTDAIKLHEPISIYDVDNVIEYMAMENYVTQLSRGASFGSTTFAFTIRKIEQHYGSLSSFEFYSLISDVAEVISDTLAGHQFLMSYAGGGTFVCVTENGWHPNMKTLMDGVNLSLARTELYNNSGQELYVRVSAGDAIRLIWKSTSAVMEAVAAAHLSAEAASDQHERSLTDFWLVENQT